MISTVLFDNLYVCVCQSVVSFKLSQGRADLATSREAELRQNRQLGLCFFECIKMHGIISRHHLVRFWRVLATPTLCLGVAKLAL